MYLKFFKLRNRGKISGECRRRIVRCCLKISVIFITLLCKSKKHKSDEASP